jgi:hypothetical protein
MHFMENGLSARNAVLFIGVSDSPKFLFRESKEQSHSVPCPDCMLDVELYGHLSPTNIDCVIEISWQMHCEGRLPNFSDFFEAFRRKYFTSDRA